VKFQNLFAVLVLLSCSSCINLFGFADQPGDDAQYLSAARACFDQGDLECARKYYNLLSSAYADQRQSGLAYTILDENGAGMGEFLKAFAKGEGAGGLNKLANALAPHAGLNLRLALFSAFQKVSANGEDLIADINIRGLTRFVTAVAVAAEILAEATDTDGLLQKTDIASGGAATCSNTACAGGNAACNAPGGSVLQSTDNVTDLTSADTTNGSMGATNPELGMLNAALQQAVNALNNELSVSGAFSSDALATFTSLGSIGIAINGGQCYRYKLISVGVGE
jgi:hypothetical protein